MAQQDHNEGGVEELSSSAAAGLASLVGIGCQSGDVVMGLSALRRVNGLAFVFADTDIAPGTMAEVSRQQKSGTRVFRVSPLSQMTASAGRTDVSIMGVKSGSLADGIRARLESRNESSTTQEQSMKREHQGSASFTHLLEGIGREELKITEIKITPISYKPADGSYVHECGPVVLTKCDETVVEVFTDQGLVGIAPGATRLGNHDHLIGRNPFDVELMALSPGLDVACWDLIGKAKGVPVYKLLATDTDPSPKVKAYASGGVNWTYYDKGDGSAYGAEALIEEALGYKEMGFDTFKWRPGTDWEEDGITPTVLGEICRQLREAVGPDFDLGLEKKGYDTWTLEECLEIAPIIDELGFLFFEQPMGDVGEAQFDDYLRLKETMPRVMLWGGEGLRSASEMRPWLVQGIYDALQTDCHRIGVTENWYIGRVAGYYGRKMVMHNWNSGLGTMCNAHYIAGVPSGHMVEFFLYPNEFRYGLFTEPMRPHDGYIVLSDKPGFGLELAPDFAERFPHIPGTNTFANPRYPHALERARVRSQAVVERYNK
jgi:L-alanine-DL-glutamate epimerase-like enolase superfamily enzyme